MSKTNRKIEWPTVSQVCEELTWVRDRCCQTPPDVLNDHGEVDDRGDTNPFDDHDSDDLWMDVRLQVYPNGTWAVHTGDASYDTDHRGYWGAGSLAWDSDCEELAAALIDEAKDHAADSGEDVEEDDEPTPEEEDVYTSDGLVFTYCRRVIVKASNPDEAREELNAWMDREQYFPNVWFVEERGNVWLMGQDE